MHLLLRRFAPPAAVLLLGCSGATVATAPAEVTTAAAVSGPTSAAQTPKSVADPGFLGDFAQTYRFRLGQPRAVTVVADGSKVLFLRSGSRSFVQDLYELDTKTGKEQVVLTAKSLLKGAAEHLSATEKARRERLRQTARGLASFQVSKDGKSLLVPLSGRLYLVTRATGAVRELSTPKGKFALTPRLSPDGKWVSYVVDGDAFVHALASDKPAQLTKRAGPAVDFGSAEFVAQEEMQRRDGLWWSPDSKSVVVQKTDNTGVEQLHTYDPAHPERASHGSYYPRPGKKNAVVTLLIYPTKGGKPRQIQWDNVAFEYLVKVVWPKAGPLTIVVQDRAQRRLRVLRVDTKTGETTQLLEETDAAWINIDPQMPRWLKTGGFLWTTESGGAWQLQRRSASGALAATLTGPNFGYRKLAAVDEKTAELVVVASNEPTESHLWAVPLLAKGGPKVAKQLTKAAGQHALAVAHKTGVRVFVSDTLVRGKTWRVESKKGGVHALRSVAEKPKFAPSLEYFTLGERQFRGQLFKPRNFDPKRRYPVIVYVYGGPHWAVVARSSARWALRQWIADHGYLVASFDGRGTPNRGREWERAIAGNFIAAPMADQVAALHALAKKVPQMDTERVGIFGWSFGGYFSAMAGMRRPDVYRCAVAGAPVTDWRDYDTHYTERYIGLPDVNAKGYDDSSALHWGHKLERPLLLVHGTADDNVYFTHAIKLSNTLFRAGKTHEFLPLTGFTHMVADPKVLGRLYGRILGHFGQCLR